MQNIAAVVINDLRAAAAYLQNDPFGNIHGIDDAAVDVSRLFLFGKNAYLYTAGCLNFVEERTLIFGAADRRRRNGDNARNTARVAQALKHF